MPSCRYKDNPHGGGHAGFKSETPQQQRERCAQVVRAALRHQDKEGKSEGGDKGHDAPADLSLWQLGSSRVFFRPPVLERLEADRAAVRVRAAIVIQKRARGAYAYLPSVPPIVPLRSFTSICSCCCSCGRCIVQA